MTTTAGEAVPLPVDLATRPGSDWPGFLGPTQNGVSPEQRQPAPWPAHGPRLVWQTQLGEGYAAPSISRGRLLIFERVGNTARCRCLHAETGKQLWQFDYPTNYVDHYGYSGGSRACPVIADGRVFLHGPEGMLHCLRLADGEPLWQVDTAAAFGVVQNFFGAGSAPVPVGDVVLLPVGGSPPSPGVAFGDLRGNGSALVAFDQATGQVRWQAGDELASYATPVLAPGPLPSCGVHFARGGLFRFQLPQGAIDLHFPWRARILESVNASNPVWIDRDRVFITEAYGQGCALLQLGGTSAKLLWEAKPRERDRGLCCHMGTPIVVDGHLYGCHGRHSADAELRCVEVETGRVKWRRPGLGWTTLLHVAGRLIVLTEDGVVFCVQPSPSAYTELARWEPKVGESYLLEPPCWAAPVFARGLLYLRGANRLICLELIPPPRTEP